MTEAPICIPSYILYLALGRGVDPTLPTVLTAGAAMATPFGTRKTSILDLMRTLRLIEAFAPLLGTFTVLGTLLF